MTVGHLVSSSRSWCGASLGRPRPASSSGDVWPREHGCARVCCVCASPDSSQHLPNGAWVCARVCCVHAVFWGGAAPSAFVLPPLAADFDGGGDFTVPGAVRRIAPGEIGSSAKIGAGKSGASSKSELRAPSLGPKSAWSDFGPAMCEPHHRHLVEIALGYPPGRT